MRVAHTLADIKEHVVVRVDAGRIAEQGLIRGKAASMCSPKRLRKLHVDLVKKTETNRLDGVLLSIKK